MSGSISNFFDDVGDELENDIDVAATEVGDASDDVRDEVDDDDVTAATAPAPTATTTAAPAATAPATPAPTAVAPATNDPRSAQIARLYDTAFDRPPDEAGLTFWTNALRAGNSLDTVADLFITSPEFQSRYGNLGTGEFVDRLYLNVLDRPADPVGRAFWTSGLERGVVDRSDVVVSFSEAPERVAAFNSASTDDPLI